ncbi:nucleotide-binding protein [Listeria booriae]|uniref:hypothetical protein n=1 Tax=Listeria booriae TaxID=1552123 RepID=UPI001624A046|nr:hypothetical protein [Listeria booriae]MBC2077870.1 nucleotide-binding protein [Listeria booriae]
MKNRVFFSWQSDLPNSTNRNFIEGCIKKSINNMKKNEQYNLILSIDRDTVSVQGTPDIADSIFSKIDKATFFVADISIINSGSRKYRKTPNPNVLIELGYAVNKLGWDRVICFFNTDFGKLSDLPFDLRNRRIITYQTQFDKQEQKKGLIKLLNKIFEENYLSTLFSNELIDYYNVDIYSNLFRIISDFSKAILGYEDQKNTIENTTKILNMSKEQIKDNLSKNELMGFTLFKSYEEYVVSLSEQLEKIVTLKNFNDHYYVPIIKIIKAIRSYNKELNRRGNLDEFKYISKNSVDMYITNGDSNSKGENRRILLRKIDSNRGIVIDFGDFQRKDHIDNLLTIYRLQTTSLERYSSFIINILYEINQWIDNNDGEFIIDNTSFEIYKNRL